MVNTFEMKSEEELTYVVHKTEECVLAWRKVPEGLIRIREYKKERFVNNSTPEGFFLFILENLGSAFPGFTLTSLKTVTTESLLSQEIPFAEEV